MSTTLLNLADAYESEARRMWISQRDRWALRDSASLFRRMVCNRKTADPSKLELDLSMLLDVAERWCRQHGYRAVVGHGGYILQRGDEPAIVARFGDTLLWNGQRITVEANH
ncbi:hypothetical protein [Streptomyces sp. NPDC046859]|uniref:hypothetical protein n=1 Tax=Streptomyces sp. NPDC046859 TaxID=3155734 RepID=UPI0033F962CE